MGVRGLLARPERLGNHLLFYSTNQTQSLVCMRFPIRYTDILRLHKLQYYSLFLSTLSPPHPANGPPRTPCLPLPTRPRSAHASSISNCILIANRGSPTRLFRIFRMPPLPVANPTSPPLESAGNGTARLFGAGPSSTKRGSDGTVRLFSVCSTLTSLEPAGTAGSTVISGTAYAYAYACLAVPILPPSPP